MAYPDSPVRSISTTGSEDSDVEFSSGVISMLDPRGSGKEGYFMVERGADVGSLKAALQSIFGTCPTGFMRDRTVFPLRMLAESPELFAESDPGKTTKARRLVALFNPRDYPANALGEGVVGNGEEGAEEADGDDECEAYFRIMDLNADGELHSEEMMVYLSTAYRFLMKYESLRHGVDWTLTPEELAEATVLDCFNYSGRVLGDQLDYLTFYKWFQIDDENETRDVMVKAINLYEGAEGADVGQVVENTVEVGPSDEEEDETGAAYIAKGDGDSQSSGATPPSGFHISLKDAIEEMQIMTGINEQNVNDVIQLFQSNSDEDSGLIGRKAFESCFLYIHAMRKGALQNHEEEQREQLALLSFLEQVFGTLETTNGSEVVDVLELCASMSILCDGSATEKIRAAFDLCDTNDDGFISKQEFTEYLTAVFSFLCELSGEAFQLTGMGPGELAVLTADKAFPPDEYYADNDDDEELISYGEFKKWYTMSLGEFDIAEVLLEDGSLPTDVGEMSRILGLKMYSSQYLSDFFKNISDEDGLLHKSSFFTGMERLVRRHMSQLTKPDQVHAELIAAKIYEIYDVEDRGYADYRDIVCGLLLLCGGPAKAKAVSAYQLFRGELSAAEGVSETEVAECFTSLVKLVAECAPAHLADTTAEDLAAEVTVRVFSTAATRLTDVSPLSLAEKDFISWFSLILTRLDGSEDEFSGEQNWGAENEDDIPLANGQSASGASTYSDMDYENSDFDDDNEDSEDGVDSPLDHIAADMRKARSQLGLIGVTADDLMEILSESDQQVLRLENWLYAVRLLARLSGAGGKELSEAKHVAEVIFDAFQDIDTDTNNLVDLATFMAGMACLCDGPPEDRVMVAFTSLDRDGDGYISAQDLATYFSKTLLIQVVCSPVMRQMFSRLSLSEMTQAAVDGCLLRVGVTREEPLSLDQVATMVEHCQALALSGV